MTPTRLITLSVIAWFLAAPSWAANTKDQEISYLLEYVSASGCIFHRNGSDHNSADAADHLRLKLRRGGRYADTAEHFIERLASKSSWTGEVYTVTCEGQQQTSEQWLKGALQDYRNNPPMSQTGAAAPGD